MRTGIQEWRNAKNRLAILRLHWTADASKRSPEGRVQMAALAAEIGKRAWLREYEIDWAAPEGEPVIPEFAPATHVQPVRIDPLRRLLRFWDFGFVSPVVLFGQLTDAGQVRIAHELCPFNTPLDQLLPMVFATTRELVHDPRKVFDAGDPAATSQTDLGSAADICQRAGIRLHTARPGSEVSYAGLRARMLQRLWIPGDGECPGIVIDPGCRNLIEALSGAFHLSPYPPYRPVKEHPYKDAVDALRYGLDNLTTTSDDPQQAAWRRVAAGDIQPTYGSIL